MKKRRYWDLPKRRYGNKTEKFPEGEPQGVRELKKEIKKDMLNVHL